MVGLTAVGVGFGFGVVAAVATSCCFSVPSSCSCFNIMAEVASLLPSAIALKPILAVLLVLLFPAVAPPTRPLVGAGLVLAVGEAPQLVEVTCQLIDPVLVALGTDPLLLRAGLGISQLLLQPVDDLLLVLSLGVEDPVVFGQLLQLLDFVLEPCRCIRGWGRVLDGSLKVDDNFFIGLEFSFALG